MFWRKKPAPPTIRPLTGADAPAVAAMHAEGFAAPWSTAEIGALIADRAILGEGAAAGGALVGFVLSRLAVDEAEILTVAVARKARRAGVGAVLLTHHLGALGMRGVGRVFLEVEAENAAALALYRRFGFVEIGRRSAYYRKADGTAADAVVMRRDL